MSNPITKMQYDIERILTCLSNMIRPATVTYVYRKKGEKGIKSDRDDGSYIGHVDVISGELELERIPVYTMHNEEDTTLWLPTEGEDGNIFSPNDDLALAFFVHTIPTKKQPIPDPDGPATQEINKKFRQGNSEVLLLKNNSDKEVNQYTHEIEVRDDSFTKFIHGDSIVTMNKDEIVIEHKESKITLDKDELFIRHLNSQVTIDKDEIYHKHGTSEVTIDSDKVECKKGISKCEVKTNEVKVTQGASSAVLTAAKIELMSTIVDIKCPVLNWNGTPTNPLAWVSTAIPNPV